MPLGVLKTGLGLVALLKATTAGPRSTLELVEALNAMGLEVTPPVLYPWLRRLTEEGLLTPSLLIDPAGSQVRHYWITREGTRVLEQALPLLRVMGGGTPYLQ